MANTTHQAGAWRDRAVVASFSWLTESSSAPHNKVPTPLVITAKETPRKPIFVWKQF